MPAGGQEITGQQGSFGSAEHVQPLRSFKGGSGSVNQTLSGQGITGQQGAFGKTRTRALSGSSSTAQTGSVTAPQVSPGPSDWETRATARGVLKAFKFRSVADLGENWTPPLPSGTNSLLGHGYQNFTGTPAIDTSVFLPGSSSSMRLTHPSGGNEGACGRWDTHFGGGLSSMYPMPGEPNAVTVGQNQTLWYQYRIRWDTAMVNEVVPANQGVKLFDVGDGSNKPQILHQGWLQTPLVYAYDGNNIHITLWERHGSDIYLQGGTAPFCIYPNWQGPGCFSMAANEWVTFTTRIDVGSILTTSPFNGRYWDARVRIWAKRYGQSPILIIDYDSTLQPEQDHDTDPTRNGRFQIFNDNPQTEYNKYWKLWLSPFATNKVPGAPHTPASAYYDEIVISRQEIAQPTDLGGYPTWRVGLAANQLHPIAGTAEMNNAFPLIVGGIENLINGWGGFGCAGNKLYTACATGHGSSVPKTGWYNPVGYIDLSANTPAWVALDSGSNINDVFSANEGNFGPGYYHDGRPTGRHTYYCTHYIQNAKGQGVPRVMMFTAQAIHGDAPGTLPNVDGYRLDGWTGGPSGTSWEVTGTSISNYASMWPGHPDGANVTTTCPFPGIAKHPYTEDVYINGEEVGGTGGDGATRAIVKWSSFTGQMTKMPTSPSYPAVGKLLGSNSYPLLCDAKRNRLVMIRNADVSWPDGMGVRMEFISLTPVSGKLPVTKLAVTGSTPQPFNAGWVYNVHDDKYWLWAGNDSAPVLRVWRIDPDTGVSTLMFSSDSSSYAVESSNEILSRVFYHPELRGFSFAPRWNQPLFFFPTS